MLNAEQNKRVTRTGKATPCGALMRCYWQPVALVEELAGDRPLKALTLMGEELVLFRRECGGYGLMGRRGPDRGPGRCGGPRAPHHPPLIAEVAPPLPIAIVCVL